MSISLKLAQMESAGVSTAIAKSKTLAEGRDVNPGFRLPYFTRNKVHICICGLSRERGKFIPKPVSILSSHTQLRLSWPKRRYNNRVSDSTISSSVGVAMRLGTGVENYPISGNGTLVAKTSRSAYECRTPASLTGIQQSLTDRCQKTATRVNEPSSHGIDISSKLVILIKGILEPPYEQPPTTIPGFKGAQYPAVHDGPAFEAYQKVNELYATSSHGEDHDMYPGLIVQPKDDSDVALAIQYAKEKNIRISIKSGGHQYSGACSTDRPNIMMDLGETYRSQSDLYTYIDGDKTMIRVSVSNSLQVVNKYLNDAGLFVPTGQCSYVHIGGHAQTGGYGNLARGFGLLGDHVRKIRLFDHSGILKEISLQSESESDRDLFCAILGGSPGNFGVITHYDIHVHRNTDHEFGEVRPQYFRGIFLYSKETLEACLRAVADMSDNPDLEHNYDMCVSVVSSTFKLHHMGGSEILQMIRDIGLQAYNDLVPTNGMAIHKDDHDGNHNLEIANQESAVKTGNWPAAIAVYAQWVPFTKDDKYDSDWFKRLEKLPGKIPSWAPGGIGSLRGAGTMSEITALWLFHFDREFKYPYEKRTYLTPSTTLGKDKWPETCAERIDMVVNKRSSDQDLSENCYLSCQIQCYGGKKAKFTTNANNGTSYSWRDSTVIMDLDCFYKKKSTALRWQAENDRIMKGPGSCFGEQDRRVLWASYGDWDMKKVWPCYYDSEAKYKGIGRVRAAADPNGTFTANPFAVEVTRS